MISVRVHHVASVTASIRTLEQAVQTDILRAGLEAAAETLVEGARQNTHIWTNTLRPSHTFSVLTPQHAQVFPDPRFVNPVTGQSVDVYAPHEHARGGDHAFYDITAETHGNDAVRAAESAVERELSRRAG